MSVASVQCGVFLWSPESDPGLNDLCVSREPEGDGAVPL